MKRANMDSRSAAVACILALFACSSAARIPPTRARAELVAVRDAIAGNRLSVESLATRRVGSSGFFYVVNREGTVVFHPRTALIGTSFRNNWFIDTILGSTGGCLVYRLGNRLHIVFFMPLNEEEVICLSLLADDLAAFPADCAMPVSQ